MVCEGGGAWRLCGGGAGARSAKVETEPSDCAAGRTPGVRLIQRTTRQFAVTEVGQTFYQHCKAMLVEAEAAEEAVAALQAEPRGMVRITCPVTLLHVHVGPMLARFMARYPGINLQLEATNRRVDLVGEGVDVAIRVRPRPFDDSDLVLRVLADRGHCLVAGPTLIERMGNPAMPSELSEWPGLSMGAGKHLHKWELSGPEGAKADIHFTPRLVTTDMLALREAAMAGVGVVQLPILMVKDQLASGELVRVLNASGTQKGSDPCGVSFPARPAAIGQDAGGFSHRRVCKDG